MLIRSLSILSIVGLLAGCAHHQTEHPQAATVQKGSYSTKTIKLPAFNQVEVKGLINVNLHTGYAKPSVILKGNSLDLRQVKTRVVNGRLYLDLTKGYPDHGPVTADIRGKYLNVFKYKGAGIVKGTKLRSSSLNLCINNQGTTTLGGQLGIHKLAVSGNGLTEISGINSRAMQITTKGKPNLRLTGQANLTKIDLNGNGHLAFYWVKSPSLTLRAHGCTTAYLAGVTDRLDVELWGCSKFKGRHLRAKRSFVKTHDKAKAEITTLDKQHSLARDGSDIYYYHLPKIQTNFMAYDGAVLDLRERAFR